MNYPHPIQRWFSFTCCAALFSTACSDFFGKVPDPGEGGRVQGGPRSMAAAGNTGGGANNGPVSKATALATGLNVQSIALDDQFVYATSDRGLVRIPKAGGTLTPIGIQQQGNQSSIAVDKTYVYYVTNSGGIEGIPKAGGAAVSLVPSGMGGGNGSLIVDGDMFYYTVGPYLRRAPVSGGPFTELNNMVQSANNQPNLLAVDPLYVYFVAYGNAQKATVNALPKAGGQSKIVATAQGSIGALAAATGGIAYTDIYIFGGTKLDLNTAMVGGTQRTLASITFMDSNPDVGRALLVDGTAMQAYFPGSSELLRYQSGAAEALDVRVQPHALAMDATDIYFADSGVSGGPNPTPPGLKKIAR